MKLNYKFVYIVIAAAFFCSGCSNIKQSTKTGIEPQTDLFETDTYGFLRVNIHSNLGLRNKFS